MRASRTLQKPANCKTTPKKACNHLSLGTLLASLPELQQNDSRGPELEPSVTMSPIASTFGNTIPNFRHTIDSGVRVLPT